MSPTKYTSKLHDTRLLIFGGTSGMGFCVAEAAIEHGAHVCISGSKQYKLERALSRLQSTYPDSASEVSGHICDLSQPDSLRAQSQHNSKARNRAFQNRPHRLHGRRLVQDHPNCRGHYRNDPESRQRPFHGRINACKTSSPLYVCGPEVFHHTHWRDHVS